MEPAATAPLKCSQTPPTQVNHFPNLNSGFPWFSYLTHAERWGDSCPVQRPPLLSSTDGIWGGMAWRCSQLLLAPVLLSILASGKMILGTRG